MESLKIILLIVCLSAFASNCVSLALWIGQSRIIGGRNATSSAEFVYQVSFQHVKNTSLYHYCGGAILTQDWIITAFKCVDSVDINKVRVMYGSHRLTVPGVVVEIEKIIAHPDWNHVTLEHNLVLVKTKKKIEFVPNVIGPIALPEQASEIGDEGLVSGWGVTEVKFTLLFSVLTDSQLISSVIIFIFVCRKKTKNTKSIRINCNIIGHAYHQSMNAEHWASHQLLI